jgi:hypothetical protein
MHLQGVCKSSVISLAHPVRNDKLPELALIFRMTAGRMAHDLTNKMQCVSGYLTLGEYAKAEKATTDAIKLLHQICGWLELTEDRLAS